MGFTSGFTANSTGNRQPIPQWFKTVKTLHTFSLNLRVRGEVVRMNEETDKGMAQYSRPDS